MFRRSRPGRPPASPTFDWRSYDQEAEAYDRVRGPIHEAPARDLVAALELPGDARLLDVGTGTGLVGRAASGGLAVGIDVSLGMARIARARGLRRVALAAAIDLPFRDESFDAVCCFAALHLFADPMRALDRMTEVLTPGGRVALFTSVPGRSAPLRTFESLVVLGGGARLFERDELVHALERRGFAEIRQRITGITQFIGGRLGEDAE